MALRRLAWLFVLLVAGTSLRAQENPLGNAHTPTKPEPPKAPQGEVLTGKDVTQKGALRPGATLRVETTSSSCP